MAILFYICRVSTVSYTSFPCELENKNLINLGQHLIYSFSYQVMTVFE